MDTPLFSAQMVLLCVLRATTEWTESDLALL
jgi:hypothetical protein